MRETYQRAHSRGQRGVSAELVPAKVPAMPAEAPEVGDRGGRPRACGEYGPVRDGWPQKKAADERRDMVHRVDGRIHDDTAVELGESATRDPVEMWVEEHVAGLKAQKTRRAVQD